MKNLILTILLLGILFDTYSQEEYSILKINSTQDYFNFYQNTISDLRGSSCPMYPSCANYTLEVIKEEGLAKGIILGSDRLLRCGHEHNLYNLTLQEKGFKLLDHPIKDYNTKLEFKKNKYYYPSQLLTSDSAINEISFLINNGNISEAIILINRYRINYKISNPKIDELELICLNNKKEYQRSIYKFSLLDSITKNNKNILKQYFIACYNIENFNAIFEEINKVSKDDDYTNRQLKKYVFASFINRDLISEAEKYYKIDFINEQDKKDADETIFKLKKIKKKSPELATALSIILPGSGYMYAGHFTTGLSSFLINALIGFATYTSFKTQNTGIGVLSGIIGLGFYMGNIQGSVKSIKRENDYLKESIIEKYNNHSFIN